MDMKTLTLEIVKMGVAIVLSLAIVYLLLEGTAGLQVPIFARLLVIGFVTVTILGGVHYAFEAIEGVLHRLR